MLFISTYDSSSFIPTGFPDASFQSPDDLSEYITRIKESVREYDIKCINSRYGTDLDEIKKLFSDPKKVVPLPKRRVLIIDRDGKNITRQTTFSMYLDPIISVCLSSFFPMDNYTGIIL